MCVCVRVCEWVVGGGREEWWLEGGGGGEWWGWRVEEVVERWGDNKVWRAVTTMLGARGEGWWLVGMRC